MIAALAASGCPRRSSFRRLSALSPGERRKALEQLASRTRTVVLYESPHRLLRHARRRAGILGRRQAVIARELTKIHEEFLRGDLAELAGARAATASARRDHLLIGAAVGEKELPTDLPRRP